MTARTPESVSAQLADRSILVTGKSTPPRDPNRDRLWEAARRLGTR
jgi:hypothetical protein